MRIGLGIDGTVETLDDFYVTMASRIIWEARWTQYIFRKKHSFQNPFRQNYKNMKVIKWIVKQELPRISIVAFYPELKSE